MTNKYRLGIDFPDKQSIQDFVESLKRNGMIPHDADVWSMDGLDITKPNATITTTYILSRDERIGGNLDSQIEAEGHEKD